MLGPIVCAARSLHDDAAADTAPELSVALRDLTPAERRVAQLAATGMTYKEIARRLNRSFSTSTTSSAACAKSSARDPAGRLVRILAPRASHDRPDR